MTEYVLRRLRAGRLATIAAVLALAGSAQAQTHAKPDYPIKKPATSAPASEPAPDKPDKKDADKPEGEESGWAQARKKSVEIGTQPARDVGVMKRQIPPILITAQEDPYSLKGLKTCKQLAAEVTNLNEVLGPDYVVGNELKENRAGKLAEAGGKTVINTIIPFRSIVRELTGAAPADRRMNAAVDAGLARRGFLRGVHAKQKCRTPF
ncbi:hypothetical protein J2800_003975 [Caulobacter rhizosphaerae]|uniref:Uncharacterized protein n=1 Tax=Caulobacter rhizosphaerae TaxID=2010972 RepID=A0ABU1N444_9CAUL|nr:hypothetical protein [Caulobacter rhizosphaerae]MDR6533213.1 hypothetical protein [Caulobacter rhizosphaerae]